MLYRLSYRGLLQVYTLKTAHIISDFLLEIKSFSLLRERLWMIRKVISGAPSLRCVCFASFINIKGHLGNFVSSMCLLRKLHPPHFPFLIKQAYSECLLRRLPFLRFWSSSRPISSSQLHASLHFHPCPIYLVVFKGSFAFRLGNLILRGASRLDAFSVYPFPSWLPSGAIGMTTGPPADGPSRSSRTKDSSSQISCARAG